MVKYDLYFDPSSSPTEVQSSWRRHQLFVHLEGSVSKTFSSEGLKQGGELPHTWPGCREAVALEGRGCFLSASTLFPFLLQ